MNKPCLLGVLWLQACAANAVGAPSEDEWDASVSATAEHALDAGGLDAQPSQSTSRDASNDMTRSDASRPDAAVMPSAPSGMDGGTLPLPAPAQPCGTALDFVGGTVLPDYGATGSVDATGFDLEKLGKFEVFEEDVSVPLQAETRSAAGYSISIEAGELRATVYGPSSDGGKSLANGRFPLIVGAPGFQAGYRDYAGFFRHFASYGFVVLGVETRGSATVPMHDKEALETSQAISFMLEASPYREKLDANKVVAVGHSKGGKVSFFAAAIDSRIDLVVGWDPSNAGGPPCGAIAELAGSECNLLPVAPNCLAAEEDGAHAAGILQYMHAETLVFGVPPDALTNPTPEHNSLNFYRGAPSPASLVYLDGGHASWVESGFLGLLANADVIRITKAVQTAKMLTVFYGASGVARYLPGGDYLPAQGALVRQVARK